MITAPLLKHIPFTEEKIYISGQINGTRKAILRVDSEKGWEKTNMPSKIKSHTARHVHHNLKA